MTEQQETFPAGTLVYVRQNGRLGTVLGPTDNPSYEDAPESVLRVEMRDDGALIDSTASALEPVVHETLETAEPDLEDEDIPPTDEPPPLAELEKDTAAAKKRSSKAQ